MFRLAAFTVGVNVAVTLKVAAVLLLQR